MTIKDGLIDIKPSQIAIRYIDCCNWARRQWRRRRRLACIISKFKLKIINIIECFFLWCIQIKPKTVLFCFVHSFKVISSNFILVICLFTLRGHSVWRQCIVFGWKSIDRLVEICADFRINTKRCNKNWQNRQYVWILSILRRGTRSCGCCSLIRSTRMHKKEESGGGEQADRRVGRQTGWRSKYWCVAEKLV